MNFSETVNAVGFDSANGTGEVPYDVLCEIMESLAKSGEPIEVTERKVYTKKQAMIEDLKRAIEQGKGVFPQDTRWLEHVR
jgi:hypothetical protein